MVERAGLDVVDDGAGESERKSEVSGRGSMARRVNFELDRK